MPPSPRPAPRYKGEWGKTPAFERGRMLHEARRAWCSSAPTSWRASKRIDVGKPLKQAKADAITLARYLEFFGGAADKFMGETIPYHAGYTVYTLRQPHGVTGHIMPVELSRCRWSAARSAPRSRPATPRC